jgi:hypothetical protein
MRRAHPLRPALLRAAALVVALPTVRPAFADSPGADPVAAEALFKEAVDLATSERWDSACPKFDSSQALDPSPATSIGIARCHTRSGRVASAWYAYEQARKLLLLATIPPARAESLRETIDREATPLEPRIPHLRVDLSNPPDGLSLRRGDVPLPVAALGQRLRVDPGPLALRAEAPGHHPWTRTLELAEGQDLTVTLDLQPLPPQPPNPSPAQENRGTVAPRPEDLSADPQRLAGWALFGGGVASGVAAAALGVATWVHVANSSDECDANDLCTLRGIDLRGRAVALETAAWALGVSAAAALPTGVVLLLTAPSPAAPQDTTLTVSVLPGTLLLRGTF